MSLRPDGLNRCDRCDLDVGGAGLHQAAVAVDWPGEGTDAPVTLHWCREPRDGAPRGCAGTVMGGAAVRARADAGLPLGASHH